MVEKIDEYKISIMFYHRYWRLQSQLVAVGVLYKESGIIISKLNDLNGWVHNYNPVSMAK